MEATRKTETMTEFLQETYPVPVMDRRFNVFENQEYICRPMPYSKRDFYKISLMTAGSMRMLYADRGIDVDRPALVFSNPRVPYACEVGGDMPHGYFCLFTEEFLNMPGAQVLHESPLFKVGSDPVFFVNDQQRLFLGGIFEQMRRESASDYVHKHDLLKSYVNLVLHEAMKMQASPDYFRYSNAATRIASMFFELLDRQFPVDPTRHALKLKTAAHFAACLSIHVNHLNQAIKEVTGQTTTEHITTRIISEAKRLLTHTTWSIAEIAYSLGYEYPNYFSNQFKKQTGVTPGSLR